VVGAGFAGPLRANHLYLDSREAIIEAINGFPGVVLLISHDPHLIELTSTGSGRSRTAGCGRSTAVFRTIEARF
jgi:ATPase subunit of ABC transporter with duplicated ATPase domains